jgi:hypothetical protein
MQEWWPNGIKKIGLNPRSHLDELGEKGFKIIEIDDINGKLVPNTVDSLMNKYPNESHEDINLICKRTNEIR